MDANEEKRYDHSWTLIVFNTLQKIIDKTKLMFDPVLEKSYYLFKINEEKVPNLIHLGFRGN